MFIIISLGVLVPLSLTPFLSSWECSLMVGLMVNGQWSNKGHHGNKVAFSFAMFAHHTIIGGKNARGMVNEEELIPAF